MAPLDGNHPRPLDPMITDAVSHEHIPEYWDLDPTGVVVSWVVDCGMYVLSPSPMGIRHLGP